MTKRRLAPLHAWGIGDPGESLMARSAMAAMARAKVSPREIDAVVSWYVKDGGGIASREELERVARGRFSDEAVGAALGWLDEAGAHVADEAGFAEWLESTLPPEPDLAAQREALTKLQREHGDKYQADKFAQQAMYDLEAASAPEPVPEAEPAQQPSPASAGRVAEIEQIMRTDNDRYAADRGMQREYAGLLGVGPEAGGTPQGGQDDGVSEGEQ